MKQVLDTEVHHVLEAVIGTFDGVNLDMSNVRDKRANSISRLGETPPCRVRRVARIIKRVHWLKSRIRMPQELSLVNQSIVGQPELSLDFIYVAPHVEPFDDILGSRLIQIFFLCQDSIGEQMILHPRSSLEIDAPLQRTCYC